MLSMTDPGNADVEWEALQNWHWDPTLCAKESMAPTPTPTPTPTPPLTELYAERAKETWQQRCQRHLAQLHSFTLQCSMCELGRNFCDEHNTYFDPHVFSNMRISRWVVVGQNPGFNECAYQEPFVGDAGKNFMAEINKKGLKREDFYITNIVKCYSIGNVAPTTDQVARCETILRMELTILRPILVITLGAVAFKAFCPENVYDESLGTIVRSKKFDVKVYPIYHPSNRNITIQDRKDRFKKDVEILCRLIKAYEKNPTAAQI